MRSHPRRRGLTNPGPEAPNLSVRRRGSSYGGCPFSPILGKKVNRSPMRQSLKIAISLLASLLLFAGFAVVAFSGLFNVLQASFFLPSIERVYQSDLASLAAVDREVPRREPGGLPEGRGQGLRRRLFCPDPERCHAEGVVRHHVAAGPVRPAAGRLRRPEDHLQQLPGSRREAAHARGASASRTTTRTAPRCPRTSCSCRRADRRGCSSTAPRGVFVYCLPVTSAAAGATRRAQRSPSTSPSRTSSASSLSRQRSR